MSVFLYIIWVWWCLADESDEEEIDEESDEIDDDSSLEDDFDLSDK